MSNKQTRKTEVFSNDIWSEVEFKDLKRGDRFRLFEPDGERVVTSDGKDEFICTSDAFFGPHGPNKTMAWTVETDVG